MYSCIRIQKNVFRAQYTYGRSSGCVRGGGGAKQLVHVREFYLTRAVAQNVKRSVPTTPPE